MGKALHLTILNQIVSSGTSFLLSVCLIAILGAEGFGMYGISFSAALLYGGICNALFTTQMVVNLPDRADSAGYIALIGTMLVLFSGALLCLIGIGCLVADMSGIYSTFWLASTGLLCLAYSLRDFVLRISYSTGGEKWVFAMHSASACIAFGGMLVLTMLQKPSAASAAGVVALSYLGGAIVGVIQPAIRLSSASLRNAAEELRSILGAARWTLSGVAVNWLQSQAHVYIAGILFGPAAVGRANTARLAITPFQLVSAAASQFSLPRAANLRRQGGAALRSLARRYLTLVFIAALAYSIVALICYYILKGYASSARISELQGLVSAWLFVLTAQVIRESVSTIMQAARRYREILLANLASAVVVISVGYYLGVRLGLVGLVAAIGLGELILAAILWARFRWSSEDAF